MLIKREIELIKKLQVYVKANIKNTHTLVYIDQMNSVYFPFTEQVFQLKNTIKH